MYLNIFIGLVMIAITIVIQAYGSKFWLDSMADHFFHLAYKKLKNTALTFLIKTAFLLIFLNLVQAFLWGLVYYLLPGINVLDTLEKAIYFSLITFTTLGYGDITIGAEHRILSGIEAINGILLIGWSTTLMFSAIQEIWRKRIKSEKSN